MFPSVLSRRAARLVCCVVLLLTGLVLVRGSGPAVAAVGPTPGPWWVAVTPARLLDTRPGQPTVDGHQSGGGPVGPGASRTLPVLARGGVPNGAAAVVLNVTATGASEGTYVTVSPTGHPRPLASNLNLGRGMTVSNLVVSPVDYGAGSVDIFNAAGETDIVVDVVGFAPQGQFAALSPTRLLDTRPGQPTFDGQYAGTGPVHGGARQSVSVTPRLGLPRARAAVVNITATDATVPTFVTALARGAQLPATSTLNPLPGRVTTNLAVIPLDSAGYFDLFNYRGDIHLIADVVGLLRDGGNPSFNPLYPARVLDTRLNGGAVGGNETRLLDVRGKAGVPTTGVGAVVMNLTTVDATTQTYVTAYPSGTARPLSSNITPPVGAAIANLVVVPLGPDGNIALYNAAGSIHLVADVVGWIADRTGPGTPDLVYAWTEPGHAAISWTPSYAGSSPVTAYDVLTTGGDFRTNVCDVAPGHLDCAIRDGWLAPGRTLNLRTITALGVSEQIVDPYQCTPLCPPAALGRRF